MNAETTLIQTFISEKFGELRTVTIDGVTWFIGKYVAKALDYKDTVNALKSHVKPKHKRGWQITTPRWKAGYDAD